MLESKVLELRDEGTFIPIVAVNMNPTKEDARNVSHTFLLLRRCGYACDGRPNIMLARLDASGSCNNDPYFWGDRTWAFAHHHIIENWETIEEGDVIDVRYILGEIPAPARSEVEAPHHVD